MKNDIFDIRRFGKYFISDIKTCIADFGLSLAVTCLSATLVVYALTVITNLMFTHGWSGPGLAVRLTAFLVIFFVIIINAPGKCYGNITDKQYGSFWLTLPASRMEKFVSMTLISCIIIPVTSAALFLGIDALTCCIDHTCGQSVAANVSHIASQIISFDISAELEGSIPSEFNRMFEQLSNPWIYIDDFIGMTLPFLLGALIFKKNKAAKTILALIIISTAVSMAATPVLAIFGRNLIETIELAEGTAAGLEMLLDSWVFRNIALIDTISDSIVNIACLAAIYYRIKTLKH